MEFGSAFVLVNPTDDVEEIVEADYSAGVRSAMNKNVSARGENVCLLDILDSAGQEEYSATRDQYTRSAQAFLIVFSITDRGSFEEAKAIYQLCCQLRGNSVPVVLCANKCDLVYERKVPSAEALQWADSCNVPMFNTSAKTRANIDEAFIKLVQITPRTRFDYKIAVLGAGGVGKSAITVQFVQQVFVESYDPTIEDSYRRQMVIPGLTPIPDWPALPSNSQARRPNSLSKAVKRSSGFFSLFRSGSRSSKAPSAPSASLPSYDEATTTTIPEKSNAGHKVRRIPKTCTNILMLNLGSLAPENFDMLEVRPLNQPPPACSNCSAVSLSPKCVFCGEKNQSVSVDQSGIRQAVEEYTLVKGHRIMAPQNGQAIPHSVSHAEGGELVVFCIDISGSMSTTQPVQQLQGMWSSFMTQNYPTNSSSAYPQMVTRLHCIQDAIQVHLDRLEAQFPMRKVAIITFSNDVECFFGTKYPYVHPGSIDGYDFKSIEDGMDYARKIRPKEWKTIKETVGTFRTHVKGLITRGSTALGPALALALGLAREHKREIEGAATEIFICTDGASNCGIGSTDQKWHTSPDLQNSGMHGRAFYSQAGEMALGQSAKINIIGIQGEGVALDILGVAAQISGGLVTIVEADELRRQIRTASQQRILAKNVSIKLHAAKGWNFLPDPRPGVVVSKNALTYTLAQIGDETDVGFAFAAAGAPSGDFQAQITYTSPATGDTKVRVLNRVIPTTPDRAHTESAVEVVPTGTYFLQKIAFAANAVLYQNMSFAGSDAKASIRTLRDELYATHQMLIRGAKTSTQQEELGNFTHESAQLDAELEKMMSGSVVRDQAAKTFVRVSALSRNSLLAGSKKLGLVKRREALR